MKVFSNESILDNEPKISFKIAREALQLIFHSLRNEEKKVYNISICRQCLNLSCLRHWNKLEGFASGNSFLTSLIFDNKSNISHKFTRRNTLAYFVTESMMRRTSFVWLKSAYIEFFSSSLTLWQIKLQCLLLLAEARIYQNGAPHCISV